MKASEKAYYEAVGTLDAAVRHARSRHGAAIDKFEAARAKVEKYRNIGSLDQRQQLEAERARLDYREAAGILRQEVIAAWAEYDGKISQARNELVKALGDCDVFRAQDVDQGALALISSGVMRAKDYSAMISDFSENPAVLALVRQAAKKAADAMIDAQSGERAAERVALYDVCRRAKTDGALLLESFDNVKNSVNTLSGRDQYGNFRDPSYYSSIGGLQAWEQFSREILSGSEEADAGDGET